MSYGFCFVFLLLYLSLKIVACFSKYFDEPTYFDTSMVEQRYALFPELTICPVGDKGGYKEKRMKVSILLAIGVFLTNIYTTKDISP